CTAALLAFLAMPKRPLPSFESFRRKARLGFDERRIAAGEVPALHKFIHFWLLVWRSFVRNRCLVRASALSYATLLPLIPLLAVAMSVTSSLLKSQGEQQIDAFVEKLVASVTPPAVLNTNEPPASA